MGRSNKPGTAFIKLICTGMVAVALIWASAQFIAQATPAKVLPVIGIYVAYRLFCGTLDIIKLLAKALMVVLIIYILIF